MDRVRTQIIEDARILTLMPIIMEKINHKSFVDQHNYKKTFEINKKTHERIQ
ncbi:MAG: hypothetical protein LBB34_04160 [Holosporales bacterium]|nr:hypothetical protein [Holosporales bacterium]